MKNKILYLVGFVILFLLAAFLWPTMYQYKEFKYNDQTVLVRINRFTNTTEFLLPTGWTEVKTTKSIEPVNEKPKEVNQFSDIKLGMTTSDVKFIKGKPDNKDSLNQKWEYIYKEFYSSKEYLNIVFRNDSVISVIYISSVKYSDSPELLNHQFIGYNLQSIIDYLGIQSDVSTSNDGLTRIYVYEKYHCIFLLQKNTVYGYGIYDPNYSTPRYN
jgi:hypothetical protein